MMKVTKMRANSLLLTLKSAVFWELEALGKFSKYQRQLELKEEKFMP